MKHGAEELVGGEREKKKSGKGKKIASGTDDVYRASLPTILSYNKAAFGFIYSITRW